MMGSARPLQVAPGSVLQVEADVQVHHDANLKNDNEAKPEIHSEAALGASDHDDACDSRLGLGCARQTFDSKVTRTRTTLSILQPGVRVARGVLTDVNLKGADPAAVSSWFTGIRMPIHSDAASEMPVVASSGHCDSVLSMGLSL